MSRNERVPTIGSPGEPDLTPAPGWRPDTLEEGDSAIKVASAPLRAAGLEITETDEGVVVYEQSRGRVHALNSSAAVILELCDGTRDTIGIAVELADLFGLPEPPVSLVEDCVATLDREGLVVHPPGS